jgi:tetratricopeptide (TPR) repeat protein
MNRQILSAIFVLLPLALLPVGCATRSMTFKADSQADVTLVTFNDLNAAGDILGKTPVTVDMAKISGKVVRISAAGKQSVYWLVTDAVGTQNEASIKLRDDPIAAKLGASSSESGSQTSLIDPKIRTNRLLRLIMKAYKELSGQRYQVAGELADQATKIDPEIAAPLVIKGIALLKQGDTTGAKAALEKAKSLDPEDQDIAKLITTMGL